MEKGFTPRPGRLLDQVRERLCFYRYAYSTEKSYVQWILRYICFNDHKHPEEMGKAEIARFLSYLAVNRHVSAATANQHSMAFYSSTGRF